MVVGKPGVGKSYLLNQLCDRLLEKNIPAVLIRIDRLKEASHKDIAAYLGQQEDWLGSLRTKALMLDVRPVLIFDALDATRDEVQRDNMLKIIKEAKTELDGKWNVLVSVRTYDASKSEALARLFNPRRGAIDPYPGSTKLFVEELTHAELNATVAADEKLHRVVGFGNVLLNDILRIPFFLALLSGILEDHQTDPEDIRQMQSEIELLNAWWRLKISNASQSLKAELLLKQLADKLVQKKSLAGDLAELLPQLTQYASVFEMLRCESIIEVDGGMRGRISFSHNIFFDYAVSRYTIPGTPPETAGFISGDVSRTFFLRPSFVYFFSNLWHSDAAQFWLYYHRFMDSEVRAVQLFSQLTLNTIIASEFRSVGDLNAILEYKGAGNRAQYIWYILQALRFIREKTLPADAELYLALSEILSLEFLHDFGVLIEKAISEDSGNKLLATLGKVSRNYLDYIFRTRNSLEAWRKVFLDRTGAGRGVEFVSKTFASDIEESKRCLRQVLDVIREPEFEIFYISNICANIQHFVRYAPSFVEEIYMVVFYYNETSQATTQLHVSINMALTSNRQQDFDMCYHHLITSFPIYLAADPSGAIRVGLTVVSERIYRKKLAMYGREEEQHKILRVSGLELRFVDDHSVVWGDNMYDFEEYKIVDGIINYLVNAIPEKEVFAQRVTEYMRYCISSFCWAKLVEIAVKYPEPFKPFIFPLVMTGEILTNLNTSFASREFIRHVVPYLSDSEIKELEELVFREYAADNVFAKTMVLSQIPQDRLQTRAGKAFLEEHGTRQNEKPVEYSSSVTNYTTSDWLKDKGVDLLAGANSQLLKIVSALEKFNERYINDEPPEEAFRQLWPTASQVLGYIGDQHNDIPVALYDTLVKEGAKFFSIISRKILLLTKEEFTVLRALILYAINYYTDADSTVKFESPERGYSATPRIEAAEAIASLYLYEQTGEHLALLEKTCNDENPVVRFLAVKKIRSMLADVAYDAYWEILHRRLVKEDDGFVYAVLLGNLQVKTSYSTQSDEINEVINTKAVALSHSGVFRENYADIMYWLVTSQKNKPALESLKLTINNFPLSQTVISKLLDKIHPSGYGPDYVTSVGYFAPVIEVVRHYVAVVMDALRPYRSVVPDINAPEITGWYKTINQIIVRCYFVFSARPAGRNFSNKLPINEQNRQALYPLLKPVYQDILDLCANGNNYVLMTGTSAHYFIEALNLTLHYDPEFSLRGVLQITSYARHFNYTFDSSAIAEVVSFTERLLADYRHLLQEREVFEQLVALLEIYVQSGWVDALRLLWKLDEVYK